VTVVIQELAMSSYVLFPLLHVFYHLSLLIQRSPRTAKEQQKKRHEDLVYDTTHYQGPILSTIQDEGAVQQTGGYVTEANRREHCAYGREEHACGQGEGPGRLIFPREAP
jgi:hypothetical protein